MTLPEIDHVSFSVEHAQTFFAGESRKNLSLFLLCLKKKTAYIKEVTKFSVEWSISSSNHARQPQQ